MRPAVVAGLVLVVLPAAARGNGPHYATVTDAEVLLRAGPSDKYPDTGTLAAGARVTVDREDQNGWYAVVAPPGSVSWVPFALVDFDESKPVPQNVVTALPATLAPGRVGHAQPLAGVGRCKLDGPTVLMAVGQPVKVDGKLWVPVAPPDGDYRYVPKSAVRVDGPANTSFTVTAGTGSAGLTPAGATVPAAGLPPPAADRAGATHPLWARADELDRAGRYDEAEALFFQVARETADHDLANRCYSRIHTLREKKRDGPAGGGRQPPDPRAHQGADA
ncbi:MAG: SH3 domain-containing protein, partial [Gemmataceae bacterium]|nr:SH3 domain-containing protein [Gemmataceae bacterium]